MNHHPAPNTCVIGDQ